MKIGIVLSIREKSKRFPGKVLKEIHGQTVTEHLIDRIKTVKNADHFIIGTSDDPRDIVFGEIAARKEVDIYYGDQEDKLLRYLQICNHFGLGGVVIVDGDDILCFPEIIEENVTLLKTGKHEVVFWKNLPLGAASSGLTVNALEKVIELKAENDTEVWGGYFFNSDKFTVLINESPIAILNHPEIRMTLDYEEDYKFLHEVFNNLYNKNKLFGSKELMELIINIRPELCEIIGDAQRKYEEHIKKAKPIRFK